LIKSYSMKRILPIVLYLLPFALPAQTVSEKLQKAFTIFEKDEQLKHAISSLYVIDAKTWQVVFDKNAQIGLAPASTQKIITSVTAFELLGKDYRYKTELGYEGKIQNDTLLGDLVWKGSGDPTFGSWRYSNTRDTFILRNFVDGFKKNRINFIKGKIFINRNDYTLKDIPDGWIWQDIGNYYGATAMLLNWKENQQEITLKSENLIGGKVGILEPGYRNELKAASKGSGDNAYAYLSIEPNKMLVTGTIPINEPAFKISIANLSSSYNFFSDLGRLLINNKIYGSVLLNPSVIDYESKKSPKKISSMLGTHYSPSLDSIIYWFNKKSINLYGEALIKTFAYEKQGFGSTDSGVAIVKKFWKGKGLDEDELNIYDGSGLSPMNRVTTHAQVEILKYAKKKDWYPYFLKSLPEYNGITMKSGTIGDVKGFCGYHKAKDGREYVFSFLVNNYSGKTSGVVGKMYKVLDELK
jgi:D-alanyl-D-alanine carboxypeptidase/D-alanyl-D-alanine-endopeptidase (penicillin-binding protein 4)